MRHGGTERKEKEHRTGKKPRGPQPKEPQARPRAEDQVNLTDSESRIMPTSGGGFEQAYNAQASVDMDSLLIVENHVSQPLRGSIDCRRSWARWRLRWRTRGISARTT
jgi:hypothetical protein